MEFQTYSMSGKPQAWGSKMSNYTQHLLKEVNEKIFHQNTLLHHLVNRMSMVEYLTDSPDKLEEKWAVSADKLWR